LALMIAASKSDAMRSADHLTPALVHRFAGLSVEALHTGRLLQAHFLEGVLAVASSVRGTDGDRLDAP